MQTKIAANAQAMKRWLSKAETTLGNHSDRLNAINIFPVADGDTGTNLYLTVRAAAQALQGLDTAALPQISADSPVHSFGPPDPAQNDVGAVLARAGQAAMEQARGNSGTLFAVFLCAAAEPLAGHPRLSAPLLAAALNRAQLRAWSALSDPVPGTMLSVMEAAARAAAAVDAAHDGDDSNHALGLALDAAVEAAVAAVVRTEDQLEALHDAHVVDAGGVGMLLILDCLRSAVLGEELQDQLLDGLHGYDVQDPHIHAGHAAGRRRGGHVHHHALTAGRRHDAPAARRNGRLRHHEPGGRGRRRRPARTAGASTCTCRTPNRPWPSSGRSGSQRTQRERARGAGR